MPVRRIIHSARFQRSLKTLPIYLVDQVIERTVLLQKDLFHPPLRTHKLHGKLSGLWSFSVDQKYRVVFQRIKSDVILLDVGDHAVYQ